ncbi:MAG: hypothetical protein OFPI_00990 [Osedax symbiont Rs2]|nr:MAG: hypothetical protein OFPI_00990 [Osedax symbiont Rs2]
MKLLIPISSFFGAPKSELWQLDTETKEQRLLTRLPCSGQEVAGKGFTSLAWINKGQLVGCDYNRVFILDRTQCDLVKIRQDNQYNDLHHISVEGRKIYLANTGRDCIDILDHQLRPVERLDFLPDAEVSARVKGQYDTEGGYYDNESSTIKFNLRKVPDKWHLNHVIKVGEQLGNRIIATSFKQQYLLDAVSRKSISNDLPYQPHDGFVYGKFIWITTVSGQIYRAALSIPLHFELFFDLFLFSEFKGWCRGLLVTEDALYVGITVIHKESSRTLWLNGPIEDTRTGIYRIDLRSLSIDSFYDFSHQCGNRIFSIIGDH